jgi:hypothetical protein
MKSRIWRAMIEMAFIIFLFYANLLMGEFERSGMGRQKGLGHQRCSYCLQLRDRHGRRTGGVRLL